MLAQTFLADNLVATETLLAMLQPGQHRSVRMVLVSDWRFSSLIVDAWKSFPTVVTC